VGALVAYGIGYWGGRPVILRWGRILRITPEDLDKIETFFARHGAAAAFFGRLIPVVRSLVSFGAGVGRMPIVPFVIYTILGSLPFTFVLVYVGVQLGANWEAIGAVLKQFEYAILGILVLIVLAFLWFRFVRPRRRAAAGATELTGRDAQP
jgi:membrane protein DedA with SNARE-associated domain